ncbi:MAG: helix-turn-helix domain-containing protein [Candidatus Saccharimonadales bacterium]
MNDDKLTIQKLLHDLDFSDVEAETYWALLNLEAVSIRKVADFSGINRGTTYEAIKNLVAAGLASTRKSGEREYYSAESPEKVYDLIRDKRKELWHTQQQAQKLVPELLARKARPQGRPLVKYYEDDEGVATILKDVLQTCGQLDEPEYYVYSSRALRQSLYRKFPNFTERRVAEGIAVKVIALGEGSYTEGLSERKWLPEPADAKPTSYMIIYGNKVAQISISNDFMPYGVVVEDTGVATVQRLLFERLWATL